MENMYPKFTRTISIVPQTQGIQTSPLASPLGNSSLLNTMFQLKQGNASKHNKTISEFMCNNNNQKPDKPKQLRRFNFQPRDLVSKSKDKRKRTTACFGNQIQNTSKVDYRRQNNKVNCYTQNSDSDAGGNSYIEQNGSHITDRLHEFNFRNKDRKGSIFGNNGLIKQNITGFKSQSPPSTVLSKQNSSIQFVPFKSPKYQKSRMRNGMNTFNQDTQKVQLIKQINQLNENMLFLNKQRQQNFKLISQLNKQIMHLKQQTKQKQYEFKTKQNIFLQQINKLLKHKKHLQNELLTHQNSLSRTPSISIFSPKNNENMMNQLKQKDLRIKQLQNINYDNETKIDFLVFQNQNLKSRTYILNKQASNNQSNIFEEAYKHLENEIEKYKQKIIIKDQQIKKMKNQFIVLLNSKASDNNQQLVCVEQGIRYGMENGGGICNGIVSAIHQKRLVSEEQIILSPGFGNLQMSMVLQIYKK